MTPYVTADESWGISPYSESYKLEAYVAWLMLDGFLVGGM